MGDRHDRLGGQNSERRPVAGLGHRLTPVVDGAHHRPPRIGQVAGALELQARIRIGHLGLRQAYAEQLTLLFDPAPSATGLELLQQSIGERQQVGHVLTRVPHLVQAQRPATPVRALLALADADPQLALQQRLQAQAGSAQEARGDLRVQHAPQRQAEVALQREDVVVAAVQHPRAPGAREQRAHGLGEAVGDRIVEHVGGARADLQQADALDVAVEGVGL